MAQLQFHFKSNINWKWWGVAILLTCGFLGFLSGVEVSDRPGLPDANVFTKIYYAFGLFVLGGLDLGTPTQGPLYGRVLLWIAYFGAPALTASAVIESLFRALAPHSWHLRKIKNHVVIIGSGDLTFCFLKKIREAEPKRPILVIADDENRHRLEEMQAYGRIGIVTALSDPQFVMRRLRMSRAHRIFFLLDHDIMNCEGATNLIERDPGLASRIYFHVSDLRFLRILQHTKVATQCTSFNSYQVAAAHIAQNMLIKQFDATGYRDTVVLAGYGRFGQTILEELEQHSAGDFSTVAIIDLNAKRNVQVSDQYMGEDKPYTRHIIEGDVDHPEVWKKLFREVVIVNESPVFILSTGSDEQNMGASIRLRQLYPDALIISRAVMPSAFAKDVCREHNIVSINMTELMEEAIPRDWYIGDPK